jgi:SAM-dependent methyltransferase
MVRIKNRCVTEPTVVMNQYITTDYLSDKQDLLNELMTIWNVHGIEAKMDAQLKWTSIAYAYKQLSISPQLMVDVGCNRAPLSIYLKQTIPTVYAVDIEETDHRCEEYNIQSRVIDFYRWNELDYKSVDLIIDGCSIIHMDLEKSLEKISLLLKSGGYFICASDCVVNEANMEFINPQAWIELAQKYGLQLTSSFNFDSSNGFHLPYLTAELYILTMVFTSV